MGRGASIWYNAAVRGNVADITIGAGSNVQDNATVHCDSGKPKTIGANVSIAHNAVVHGRSERTDVNGFFGFGWQDQLPLPNPLDAAPD